MQGGVAVRIWRGFGLRAHTWSGGAESRATSAIKATLDNSILRTV